MLKRLFIFIVTLSVPLDMAVAQNYVYATGSPSYSTQIPIENGFINVNNGEIHMEISLAAPAQRGNMNLNERLIYDSRFWQIFRNNGYSWQPTNIPNSLGGWRYSSGTDAGSVTYSAEESWPGCNTDYEVYFNFDWQDSSGTKHIFPINTYQIMQAGQCQVTDTPSGSAYAVDGTGYYATVTNYDQMTIWDSKGNEVYPQQIDTNGNYWSNDSNGNLVDTGGRTPVLVTTNGNQTYYDVLINGGQRVRYTVTTEQIPVKTNFQQQYVSEYNGTITVIQSIQLPDSTSYTFGYDSGNRFSPGYGELTSVTLPKGGSIIYSYVNFFDSFQNANRWVHTRVKDGGTTTFAPSVLSTCSSNSGCQEAVTVTAPSQDITVYKFSLDQGSLTNAGSWNQEIDKYTGPESQPALVKQITTNTTGVFPLLIDPGVLNIQQYYTYNTSTTTTSTLGPSGPTSQATSTFDRLGSELLKTQQWDYYTGSAPAYPTKEVDYTYGYNLNNAALLTQETLLGYTSSGMSQVVSQTSFGYDETTPTSTTNLPQHQAISGGRGNLTSTTQLLSIPGSSVTSNIRSTTQFDDAGMVLSTTAPQSSTVNLTTNYIYESTDTYLQEVIRPSTNGFAHVTYPNYDVNNGAINSVKDENGQSTTYTYDSIGRLQNIGYPDGGSTTYSYPSALEVDTSVLQANTPQIVNVSSATITDSYGRPVRYTSGNYVSTIAYDTNGRVSCTSNPYISGTASPTDGSVCVSSYDGLDRVLAQLTSNGSYVIEQSTNSYSGNTTTVTDGVGHSKETVFDAFGRISAVYEPDSSGALNWLTSYAYNAMDEMTSVVQQGNAASTSWRTRTFAYDSLGRKIQQTTPEAGTTCFGLVISGACQEQYDLSGNLLYYTNGASNVVGFTYDALNRVLTKSSASFTDQYTYDTATLSGGFTSSNPIGRLVQAARNGVASQQYSYDPVGRITYQTSSIPTNMSTTANALQVKYDLAGNMTSLTYPDGRQMAYSYDNLNRLLQLQYAQWNGVAVGQNYFMSPAYYPPGQISQFSYGSSGVQFAGTYNSLGLPTAMSYKENATTLWSKQYTWANNAQNLTKITDVPTGVGRNFGYDTLNRLISAQDGNQATSGVGSISISGTENTQGNAYNGGDPDSGEITVNVGSASDQISWGDQTGVPDNPNTIASRLASAINGDSSQPVTAMPSGNQVILTAKTTGSSSNYALSVSLNDDYSDPNPSFSVSSSGNTLTGGMNAGIPSGALSEAYTLDPWGNMTESGNFSFNPPLGFNPKNQMGGAGISYDGAGRQTQDMFGGQYTYNEQGQLLTSTGTSSATYLYDASGNRVEKNSGLGTTEYVYLGNQVIATYSPSSNVWTDLIYAGSQLLADVQGTQAASPHYYLKDHLGSLAVLTDNSGNVLAQTDYAPYGQLLSGTAPTSWTYTGLEFDKETSSYRTPNRQMMNLEMRWLTPDPYDGSMDSGDPQSFNRYSYVGGKPLIATDPTGLQAGDGPPSGGGGCDLTCELGTLGVVALSQAIGSFINPPSFNGSLQPRPDATGDGPAKPYPGYSDYLNYLPGAAAAAQLSDKGPNRAPSKVGCSTVLPNGKTLGQYINQGRAQMQASVNAGGSLNGGSLTTFASIARDYGQIDFKNGAAGSSVLWNRAELGQAGNFAYYAIGSGYLSPTMLDIGASAYSHASVLLGKKSLSSLTGRLGIDASAASVRNAALATPGCPQ